MMTERFTHTHTALLLF